MWLKIHYAALMQEKSPDLTNARKRKKFRPIDARKRKKSRPIDARKRKKSRPINARNEVRAR
jgi:hypothetical protein